MRSYRFLAAVMLLVMVCRGSVSASPQESAGVVDATRVEQLFVMRVLPLLRDKCFACHGNDPEDLRGDYDMRSRAKLLAGGESDTVAVVVGDADASPLYWAVTWDGLEMPPKENDRLTAAECDQIAEWINGGAPWPDADRLTAIAAAYDEEWNAATGRRIVTSGGLSEAWDERRYSADQLWAYRPLETGFKEASIDDFIDAALQRESIAAAPLADRRTLLRRATYDLIGLPPTAEEIAAFEADTRDDATAFAEVVERLLASPQYGERWARHWLDVVRYADSSGFANDYQRGNAWRYRDYVIRAFNDDKPYDQFVREQIAGDELDPTDPEMKVAVGFLRMGPWELTGMEVAKVARQRFLDDVTNSVGETFLAHPLQCARCHDHKFDPVPTRDYYAIQACFSTTQLAERAAEFLPRENLRGFEQRDYLLQLRTVHEGTLDELDAKQLAAAARWYRDQSIDATAWERVVSQRLTAGAKPAFKTIRNQLRRQGVPEDEIPPKGVGFTPQDFGMERVARKGLERLRWELDRYEPYALSVYNGATPAVKSVTAPQRVPEQPFAAGEVEQTCILVGGDPFSPGPPVKPGALSVLSGEVPVEIPETREGRRAALAEWITHASNPLTPRVIVNRVWQWHFGRAIVGNPNNFGATGKRPTHPKLLDWLAAEFQREGWSLKQLHRTIMSSRAYRRATTSTRPYEDLDRAQANYAVFAPRRLSAEELRDSMLMASGELRLELGGIPNRPEIHREVAMQPRMVMGTFARAWVPDPLPRQRHRRSIYALSLRGLRDPAMEVMNQPGPDFSCERREVSSITPQVFALFNGEQSYLRAIAIADRVLRGEGARSDAEIGAGVEIGAGADEPLIDELYAIVLGRKPTAEERTACVEHWHAMTERHEAITFVPAEVPISIERAAVEENTGEKFRFVEPLPEYADFVPDLQPADVSAQARGLAEVALVLLNSNEFIYVY